MTTRAEVLQEFTRWSGWPERDALHHALQNIVVEATLGIRKAMRGNDE